MALETIDALAAANAYAPANLGKLLTELQGLRVSVVDGAAAGTKMNIADMREEDTILAAIVLADTWAAPTDDKDNITIQSTKASGTITISSTGPLNDETFVVNGVTYTFKTTPSAATHVKIGGTTSITLDNLVTTVNAYETRRSGGSFNEPRVTATKTSSTVVTITATDDGAGNGPVVTDTGDTITVANSGTASVTATFASAAEDDALTVNGVTFTLKDSPSGSQEVDVKGTDTLQAGAMAAAINAYDNINGTLDVTATAEDEVVTIVPKSAKKGNLVTLTENATNLAVSGSGTLANGTATGGIKSATNLSAATLVVIWFDKTPA